MAIIPRLLALVLACVVLAGQPAAVRAAERPQQEQRAGPLVMRYIGADDPAGQAEFAWYAAAVEQAYHDVIDVFGSALRETNTPERGQIVVSLYGDDAAYARDNPVAGREDSVLGHAQPTEGLIGVAVARLRDKSEGFRRDAIRHEITHIVLGDLSRQRLPIGFQEGIAQYLERDLDQRQRFAAAVRKGQEAGQLLRIQDLNRQRPFLAAASLAYPQSYSFTVFLAERYGFGNVVRLVTATRDAETLDAAARAAFDRSLGDLEAEWLAFLPGYLDSGWARNDLDLWDLAAPRRLFQEGKYAEAQNLYARAETLFGGLGQAERAATASAERQRAAIAVAAGELTQRGMAALAANEYDTAASLLSEAQGRWSEAGDTRRAEVSLLAATQAQDGQIAVAQLAEARTRLDGWRFQAADDLAFEAGQVLAELGDGPRTEEARQIMRDAQELRTRLGLAAAGGGVAGVAVLGVGWAVSRRRRPPPRPPHPTTAPGVAVMERDWSL